MRSAVPLVLVALAGEARAGSLATLREDVDGDGVAEELSMDDAGVVHVGGRTKADVAVAKGARSARLAVGKLGGAVWIVVDATTAAGREAIVLDGARGWREAARFPLGGVGLDREFSVEVDAGTFGVVRYQRLGRVERCDGKPSHLFAERFEGGAWKRLDPVPSQVAVAPVVVWKLDAAAPASAPMIYQAKGASHRPGATDAEGLAIPSELDDGRLDTIWREDLPSGGEGQFFSFHPRVPSARAHQLRIVPGNPTSAAAQKAVARPRSLFVVSAQGALRVELPDAANDPLGAAYTIDFPQPITGCVTIVLDGASGRGPTAIAELQVYAEGERAGGGEALLAKLVADGKDGSVAAAAQLARRGAAGAAALEAALATATDAAMRRRLVQALVKVKDPAATASLVRAATEGWVKDKDLIELIGALADAGQQPAVQELAKRAELAVPARIAAVKRISAAGGGQDVLVELAGIGDRELRRAVIEQLATAPLVALVQRASTAKDAGTAGDIWRALTRRARTVAADRPGAVAAMQAALASATDYERRYRLIDGIATHGDAAAIAALGGTLRALPAGVEAAALRQVAVRGIAQAPRGDAVGLVLAFARDVDPGVRLAALSVLATAEADPSGPWHTGGPDGIDRVIMNGLAADMWPEVRRRAATALGERCTRIGPAKALVDALDKDPELEVRGDSLASLVQCRAAGVDKVLARVWNDGVAPLPLRQRAVDLVVALGDKTLAVALVAKFQTWRSEASISVPALGLAQRAAATIGILAPPGAAEVLMDALGDTAFPEIVASAALGLGALGRACPPAAKAKLDAIAKSDDRNSILAKRAAAQCGK